MLDKYIQIAKFLEDDLLETKYKNFEHHIAEGQFMLPVMGQFSSGKSSFINNFLGENILPVKTTETTAYLTYISYSETENVRLTSTKGEEKTITLNLLSEIHEQSSNSLHNIIDLSEDFEIKKITVGLPNSFLKSGIVLVDTPGLNTLKSHHETLTYDILQHADYFMYVLRKSVTEKDLQLIRRIESLGTNVIIVRTHIDEVNESEESLQELIDHERNLIHKSTSVAEFFPISNIKDSRFDSYSQHLHNRLNQIFGKELKELLKESIQQRLESDHETLTISLQQKQTQEEYVSDLVLEEVQEKIKNITQNLKVLENKIKRNLRSSKFEEELSSEMNIYLIKLQKKLINLFEQSIQTTEDPSTLVSNLFSKGTDELGTWFMNRLTEIKDCCEKEYQENLKIVFQDTNFPNEKVNFTLHEVEEQSVLLDHLLSELSSLNSEIEHKQDLIEESTAEIKASNTVLNKHKQIVDAAEQELYNHNNSYETQYKIIEGKKVSDKFKLFGKALDIASLVIPASAFAQVGKIGTAIKGLEIVKDGGTAIKTLVGGSKLGKQTLKVKTLVASTKAAKQAAKIGSTLKKVKKGVDVVSKTSKPLVAQTKTILKENKDKLSGLGILNLLTFEHWAEKAGNFFDKPDEKVLDKEYEESFHKVKIALNTEYEQSKNNYLKNQYEIDRSMSKTDKIKKSIEFDKKYKLDNEKRVEKERKKIKTSQQKIINNELTAQFEQISQDFIRHQKQGALQQLKQIEEKYLQFATLKLSTKTASLQEDLILQEKKILEGKNKKENSYEQFSKYINFLNG